MAAVEMYTCRDFSAQLASSAPTPGGGGASALVGALGAALGSMVANLTLGKKKYALVEEDIRRLLKGTEELREQLLALVEEDARAFAPLAAAYGLPKETPEEKTYKEQVMEEALWEACQPPLKMMEASRRVLDLLEELARKGSALALSDVGVGAALCRAALQGAVLNLLINTGSMKNREKAEELLARADSLLDHGVEQADRIYQTVTRKLG